MSNSSASSPPVVVVTGGNGFVGSRTCAALVERGAVVRRPSTAPAIPGVEEWVGEFNNSEIAAAVVQGASAVVTTVHPSPWETDRETQHRVAAEGTPALARAARDADVDRLVHISTAGVYDRSPGVGDVDESSPLVADDPDDDYAVTKRDTDAALAEIDGLTRVLVRPPKILGPGERSTWNTKVPAMVRNDEEARHCMPGESFAWVHVDDLAAFVADVALGLVATSTDPRQDRSKAGAPSSTSQLAQLRPATTSRRSPGLWALNRYGRRNRLGRADTSVGRWPSWTRAYAAELSRVYLGGLTHSSPPTGSVRTTGRSWIYATAWNSILRPRALVTFMIVAKLGLPSVDSAL